MKHVRNAILIVLLMTASVGLVMLLRTFLEKTYQRCDHRTLTVHITRDKGFNEETKLYEGYGDYVYSTAGDTGEFFFSFPEKFTVGEYFDQCINVNFHPTNLYIDSKYE